MKMLFNTGVKPENMYKGELMKHHEVKGGTLQIAFYLETPPPTGYTFQFLAGGNCATTKNQIKIKVVDGGMLSDFAFFGKL